MKTTLLIVQIVLMTTVLASAGFTSDKFGISGSAIFYMPGEDENFDSGFGAEAQACFWANEKETVGVALALGAASWKVKEYSDIFNYGIAAVGMSSDGDVTLLPFGGSILLRPLNNPKLALTVELGARYVSVNSEVTLEYAEASAYGQYFYSKGIAEIEDGIVGVAGLNIEGRLHEQVSVIAGVGYQFDISKGDATWMGVDIGENELKAAMVKTGIGIHF